MRTIGLDEVIYSALAEEADRNGLTIETLAAEAIESWLGEAEIDDAERAEIERARAEAAESGGVEFEEFFDELLRTQS